MMNPYNERRFGHFILGVELLETKPEEIFELMGRMMILRAEHVLEFNAIKYFAASNLFAPIEKGAQAPSYSFIFDKILPPARIICHAKMKGLPE